LKQRTEVRCGLLLSDTNCCMLLQMANCGFEFG